MLKKLCFIVISLSVVACNTPTKQNIDMTKLKDEERVYSGSIQVDLNGKTNSDLTCDLFMNSDIAPTIRLSADGEYLFKTIKKTLAFTKIACLYTVNKNQKWIYQNLDIPRIKRPDESKSKEVYNMGAYQIVWTVKDSDFESNVPMTNRDPMEPIGKIKVTHTPAAITTEAKSN